MGVGGALCELWLSLRNSTFTGSASGTSIPRSAQKKPGSLALSLTPHHQGLWRLRPKSHSNRSTV